MDEQLKQTVETLEKALSEAEEKLAKIEAALANPFLKTELRVKYKKVAVVLGDVKKKLKTQIRGLKMLSNVSPEELAKLKANQFL